MSLPISAIPKPVTLYSTTLGSRITSTDTSLTVVLATDDATSAITGVIGLTIDGEIMIGTKSGTSVTGLLRGIDPQDGTTEVSALKAAHQRGAVVKITDAPFLAIVYRLLNGTEGFPNQLKYVTTGFPTPVNDYDIPTKKYVVDTFSGGSVSNVKLVVSGTAGETLAVDQLVYLKVSDGRWWLCDADTAATVDNIILGITLGSGTAGNAITSGVTVFGEHTAASAIFTANTKYYASNTAGGFSSSAGTTEVSLGVSRSTTALLLYPRYDQAITEDQQDALGGSSGTPSATNLFITQKDAVRAPVYGASTTGNDTYVITPTVAIAAYADGQEFVVLPDTGNTTTATLNVSGLGAISILHSDGTALVTGDIKASVPFVVKKVSTVFYLQTPPVALVAGATSDATEHHKHNTLKAYTFTRTQTGDTNEQTIATYTCAAGRLGTKSGFRVKFSGLVGGNNGNKTVKLKYGSTVLDTFDIPNNAASRQFEVEWLVFNSTASAQDICRQYLIVDSSSLAIIATGPVDVTDGAVDTSAQQVVSVTLTMANAGDSSSRQCGVIELLDRE